MSVLLFSPRPALQSSSVHGQGVKVLPMARGREPRGSNKKGDEEVESVLYLAAQAYAAKAVTELWSDGNFMVQLS